MSCVRTRGMRRALFCLLLVAAWARADDDEPTKLGLLVRWWLDEPSPARRADFVEAMEQMTKGEVRPVMEAIRRGEHLRYPEKPVLLHGGPMPEFSRDRPRVQKIAEAAGDVARLELPEGYDRTKPHPLVVQLGAFNLEVPPGAVFLKVEPGRHPQARDNAWAAEALTLSLIAHVGEIVHVDPARVFLRGEGKMAELAWAIALHNPDRFAGVLGARGVWGRGTQLAPNAATFSAVVIERRRGNPGMQMFFTAIRARNPNHIFLRAPREPALDATVLLPPIRAWWKRRVRPEAPNHLVLVADRDVRLRSFWLEVSPRTRSEKRHRIGPQMNQRSLVRNARIEAEIQEGNLVEVMAARDLVKSFTIWVDPRLFDVDKPLRVRVNGAPAPEARLIRPDIETMLVDYAARRDPGLLYVAAETYRP